MNRREQQTNRRYLRSWIYANELHPPNRGDRNGRGLGAFYICAGCPAWRIGMTAPAISSQSTGAVSLQNEKPGFWPGDLQTFLTL